MAKIVENYDLKRLDAAVEIASLVARTAGPYGHNVHFFNGDSPVMYRDGFKVLQKYQSADPLTAGVKRLMEEAAFRTVSTAGDGSTTTTILLRWIYENALSAIEQSGDAMISRRAIAAGIRMAAEDCISLLEQSDRLDLSNPVHHKLLRDVATLAGSNDPVVGNAVADVILAIGTDGHVITEFDPKASAVSVELRPGYRFGAGVIHPSMLPVGRASVTVQDAFVAIVKDHINKNEDLIPTVIKHWKMYCDADEKMHPLVLICGGIDSDAMATMIHRRDQHGNRLPWYTIRVSGGPEAWEDLSAITGVKQISSREGRGLQYFTAKHAAHVPSMVLSMTETIMDINEEALEASGLVGRLKEQAAADTDPSLIEARIARLEGRVGVIKIPLTSGAQKSWASEVFEDAYLASVSAVKHGICPGGGRQLCKIAKYLESKIGIYPSFDIGYQSVRNALDAITMTIMENGGITPEQVSDVVEMFTDTKQPWHTILFDEEALFAANAGQLTSLFKDGRKTGVIDSAEAIKAAIRSASDEAANWIETSSVVV